MKILGYTDFFLFSPSRKLIASSQEATIGQVLKGFRGEVIDKALKEGAFVSRPFRSPFLYPDENGERSGPADDCGGGRGSRQPEGHPQAVLTFRISQEGEFTQILQMARSGQTGETFAFDTKGMLLSQSRLTTTSSRSGCWRICPIRARF